jgi:hypothetical protein
MQYERVVKGIGRYIETEIYPGLSDWQEILARIAVSRAMNSQEQLKEILTKNAFAKMFAIIDEEGDIDVDGLMEDLKEQINAKGKIEIHIPMFGKFCFNASDVHKLHRMIMEG